MKRKVDSYPESATPKQRWTGVKNLLLPFIPGLKSRGFQGISYKEEAVETAATQTTVERGKYEFLYS